MDNWDTNTFRFRIDPEDPNTTDTPKPVEGIGIAETPITSTAPQETGFVLVDTPAPTAPFDTADDTAEPGDPSAAPMDTAAQPEEASPSQPQSYDPVTEVDIFGKEEAEEDYQPFTDPYGMPMRPDGTSYYSAPEDNYSAGPAGDDYGSGFAGGGGSFDDGGTGNGGGYDGGGYYGGGHGSGAGGGYGQKVKAAPAPMQLTRRAFVLILILAMLLTSALTVGGIALLGNTFSPKDTSATNYTLTESKETLDIASIVEKSNDTIVSITTEGLSTDMWAQNYITKGAGSGVIVQSDGYIVTCYHVIDGASKITVTTSDSKTYQAELVGTDQDNDLAVIKINATKLHAVKYADSTKLEVGDQVVAIGNPLGQLSNTATTGIISALNRNLTIEGQKLNLLQTDASINPGNSGGALLDASGNLVGIVESKSSGSDVEGLGFAVPVNTVAKSVKEIIETGSASKDNNGTADSQSKSKAVIGIIISELSDEQAMMYGYPQGGILITSVTSDQARQAGLQRGDMITSMDGTKVTTMEELHTILSKHKVGDKVKLQVLRDGQTITITTKLVNAEG